MCDPSDQSTGWIVLVCLSVGYFAVLYVSVRQSTPGARVRIAATWLFCAVAVTLFVIWAEPAGLSDPLIVAVCGAVVIAAALGGMGIRGPEAAWRYVTAGVLGGLTPIALFIALLASLYARGDCLV